MQNEFVNTKHSMTEGDGVKRKGWRKGIILAGGNGTRLYPLTKVLSKQLMPVYDKPMIYYPLATLMQAGIFEILIITTQCQLNSFKTLLGNGSHLGIEISYAVQPKPNGLAQAFIIGEDFIADEPVALILGDNIFYGHDLIKVLRSSALQFSGATVFGYHVSNPGSYGVVEFDEFGAVISIEEKPEHPKSNYAIPGLYFFDCRVVEFAKKVSPSARGEFEITDILEMYRCIAKLQVKLLGRGTAWLDTGTHDDLLAAAQFIATLDKRQGLKVNCPEEIAFRKGWINKQMLRKIALPLCKSGYGEYLLKILNEKIEIE
jgi:glucose-1-phosphate thymidylyltransferase